MAPCQHGSETRPLSYVLFPLILIPTFLFHRNHSDVFKHTLLFVHALKFSIVILCHVHHFHLHKWSFALYFLPFLPFQLRTVFKLYVYNCLLIQPMVQSFCSAPHVVDASHSHPLRL